MIKNVVPKIVTINILVFLLWIVYAPLNPEFMVNNFLVSWNGLMEGRIWTLVTSIFSHNMFFHILINMLVFYNFGIVIEKTLGPKRFLLFYLLAGIAGSLGHSLVSAFILHSPEIFALGASGAIAGVVLLFSLQHPKAMLFLFGLVPIPALWAAILFIALDTLGLIGQTQGSFSPVGYGAHLGGALVGILYFVLYRKKIIS